MKPSKELVQQWCKQAAGTGSHVSDQLVIVAELAATWGAEQSLDGKRYRWLRDVGDSTWVPLRKRWLDGMYTQQAEAHIDNAITEFEPEDHQAATRTLLEQYDLDQSPEYRKGYEDGRLKGYEVGHRYATETLQSQQAASPTTCNCRWEGGTQVKSCSLHQAHVDAIREWAERAKDAETKLAAEPVDPMDWPLPCDVTVGHVTMNKGVKLRTLVMRMKSLFEMATGQNAILTNEVSNLYTTPPDTQAVLHRALDALKEADKLVSLDCIDAAIAEIEGILK